MTPDWFHPVVDGESKPFWDGCCDGRLRLMRCRACGTPYFYPRAYCPTCWSADTEWFEASGHGTLYSFSIVHQFPLEPFASLAPYANIIVTLEEGPRLMANWDFDVPLEQMQCDLPLRVRFRRITDILSLPIFGPVA